MFDKYDLAWEKYQKKFKKLQLPLVSWGISSSNVLEVTTFNSIQKQWTNKENYLNQIASKAVIITDENLKIIFVTKHITELTGYQTSEIIGYTPKMFQGALTSEITKKNIRIAINKKYPFKETILNYRKDGTSYWCEIEAYPKFDHNNNLINFIAFERIAS